jgi:hypothetical protein
LVRKENFFQILKDLLNFDWPSDKFFSNTNVKHMEGFELVMDLASSDGILFVAA